MHFLFVFLKLSNKLLTGGFQLKRTNLSTVLLPNYMCARPSLSGNQTFFFVSALFFFFDPNIADMKYFSFLAFGSFVHESIHEIEESLIWVLTLS